ncbi:hypothetical protein Thiosp_02080 [Thiorhodovibrio litoralis]|nr:hypothetical protein Thiosp_02080 [Thiorhodovibrio litoralis]
MRLELLQTKRFLQPSVKIAAARRGGGSRIGIAGNSDNGIISPVRLLRQQARHLIAVKIRQTDIQQDKIHWIVADHGEHAGTGIQHPDPVTELPQQSSNGRQNIQVVIHNQHVKPLRRPVAHGHRNTRNFKTLAAIAAIAARIIAADQGQGHAETATLIQPRTAGVNLSFVQTDDLLDQHQTEPQPGVCPIRVGDRTVKNVEHMWQEIAGNALAAVRHLDAGLIIIRQS